ncbi:MAG: HAD-IA family hydrolase [Bacteroidota bacterium]
MKRLRHIIFDCDGVLVDSEIVAAQVSNRYMNNLGLNFTLEDHFKNFSGMKYSEIFEQLIKDGLLSNDLDYWTLITEIEQEVMHTMKPIEGVSDGLNEIKDLPKAIVSNSQLFHIKHSLEMAGIEMHFGDKLFSAEMVEKPKPNPMVYLHAAESLKVEPTDCLVIEDSTSGVKAAVEAGMHVIAFLGAGHILPGHEQKVLDIGAKKTFDDMSRLREMVYAYEDAFDF